MDLGDGCLDELYRSEMPMERFKVGSELAPTLMNFTR
jgi:hypothetical protein